MAIIYDFAVLVPDWFKIALQEELNKHDLGDMCGCGAINVSDEHPFLTVQNYLKGGATNLAGIMPAIAAVEGGTTEDPFLGQSMPDQEFVSTVDASLLSKLPDDMDQRYLDFLVSDNDLRQIRDWIAERGTLIAVVTRYFVRESVLFSVWCTDRRQRTFLGIVLLGALRKIRKRLAVMNPRVTDVEIKITRGMINNNFGTTLLGMEATMSFANWHSEIEIDGSVPEEPLPPELTLDDEYRSYMSGDEPTRITCAD